MPPYREQSKGNKTMPVSSKHRMRWTRLVVSSVILPASLLGCASRPPSVEQEKAPIPAEWKEKQLPAAMNYSEKVQAFLQKVQRYQSETPVFTTHSPQQ